ncbi:hypothetical protein OMP40_14570 [Cohnella rhizosphaerae]|uniref:Uncharacterized protein n=1 Tax=Cohnella rhizosphaerae TaxID=1457232 RepID=A0A9X4KT66_9BACL|nr:hypothetical protein [Cohnella rhizosphaerae]
MADTRRLTVTSRTVTASPDRITSIATISPPAAVMTVATSAKLVTDF